MKKHKYGSEIDKMPNAAFRIMTLVFRIGSFFKPMGRSIDNFGIKKGSVVIDYGCGPGMYIKKAVQTDGYEVEISDNTADLIYALDMFHKVKDSKSFLMELNRIGKRDCTLILEDGPHIIKTFSLSG